MTMPNITVVLSLYRRPHTLAAQVAAIRAQTVKLAAIWAFANDPQPDMLSALAAARLDRVVTSSENTFFHARFALAMTARTEYVVVVDDDTISGPNWFVNCLETEARTPGILGTAGIVLHGPGYGQRTMHGWQRPSDETVEVDLVGQAWFLRTEWVRYLFAAPAVTGTNGEDIELSARAFRLAGIRSYCPPHPASDPSRWGSTRGLELGVDQVAASLTRADHEAQRDEIVRSEMAAGWLPLFCRPIAPRAEAVEPLAERTDYEGGLAAAGASCGNAESSERARGVHLQMTNDQGRMTPFSNPQSPPLTLVYGDDAPPASNAEAAAAHNSYDLFITEATGLAGDLPVGRYQSIHLDKWLGFQTDPLAVLRRACEALAPGGRITATFLNARHHAVVGSLFAGEWNPLAAVHEEGKRGGGEEGKDHHSPRTTHHSPLRIFTPREVEKLLFRAGFQLLELTPEPSDELAHWRAAGSPGEIKIGAMHIAGLSTADAEQFHSARYRVVAEAEGMGAKGRELGTRNVERGAQEENGQVGRVEPASNPQSAIRDPQSLTSIIIVTHNALAYTQQLLPNLRFFTDEPYELIFVDNASTDGTIDYLRSCGDVKLIENVENRGFPAAANQGYQASRGEYVLFMNNDVLVTTGWLTRMLRAINHSSGIRKNSGGNEQGPTRFAGTPCPRSPADNPQLKVGLVGPCSNFVSGAQQVMPGYDDLTHLDGWAWEFGKQFDRHVEPLDRLIGFCLLVRREVLDQIGAFDERFGLGNYEDDDLCRRAIAAGWQCVIARDAYVHHFGHASFAAAGVDLQGLLAQNQKLYEEKWNLASGGVSPLLARSRGQPAMVPP
jgi:GT2 family glycosyltransferase